MRQRMQPKGEMTLDCLESSRSMLPKTCQVDCVFSCLFNREHVLNQCGNPLHRNTFRMDTSFPKHRCYCLSPKPLSPNSQITRWPPLMACTNGYTLLQGMNAFKPRNWSHETNDDAEKKTKKAETKKYKIIWPKYSAYSLHHQRGVRPWHGLQEWHLQATIGF